MDTKIIIGIVAVAVVVVVAAVGAFIFIKKRNK